MHTHQPIFFVFAGNEIGTVPVTLVWTAFALMSSSQCDLPNAETCMGEETEGNERVQMCRHGENLSQTNTRRTLFHLPISCFSAD